MMMMMTTIISRDVIFHVIETTIEVALELSKAALSGK